MAGPWVWHLVTAPPGPPPSMQGLPWQIERLPDGGTRVMGLEPGLSPLGAARELWPQGLTLGLTARDGESGAVEAYAESMSAGFVTGKAILSAALDPATLDGMRARSVSHTVTASAARRYALAPEDQALAWRTPTRMITFIPTARLEAEVIAERFGSTPPVGGADGARHFLYPDRGLAITLDPRGRAVLQYVHPRDFDWLRTNLTAPPDIAGAASAPA